MNITGLFKNYALDTDSYEYNDHIYMQMGGGNDKPVGGFPPIYFCSDEKEKKIDDEEGTTDKLKREYKTHKTSLSIKEILEKRKL